MRHPYPEPRRSALLARLLPEPLDVLRRLRLRDVRGNLLAGLAGEGVEVALLRVGDRVVAGDPVARVLLQRRVVGARAAEHLLVVLRGGLDVGGLLLRGLARRRGELALGCCGILVDGGSGIAHTFTLCPLPGSAAGPVAVAYASGTRVNLT